MTPLLAGYLGEVVIRTDEERLQAKLDADAQAEKDPPKVEGEIRRRRIWKSELSRGNLRLLTEG